MNISLVKGTSAKVKFKIYSDYIKKYPIDISGYLDLICIVSENNTLLIEKRLSKNGITIEAGKEESVIKNTMVVNFTPNDTLRLSPNPSDEERIRTIEIYGVDSNRLVIRFEKGDFYLEGSSLVLI